MRNIVLISLFGCMLYAVVSSQENSAIAEDSTVKEIIDTYSSLFKDQETGCSCKQNICKCCENSVGNVCLSVGYSEVFDFPTAVGLNITINRAQFISAKFDVTDPPCVRLPYVKTDLAVCLLLYGFNKTAEHVRVFFDLKFKLVFQSYKINIGCLLVPRLHPEVDSNKTVGVDKASNGLFGWKLCSSLNSGAANSPKFVYLSLLIILLLKMFRY